MSIQVKNAIEALGPDEYEQFRTGGSHVPFDNHFKANIETWAKNTNDAERCYTNTPSGPRTAKSEHVLLYHSPRAKPMTFTHETTRFSEVPASVSFAKAPSVVGKPTAISHIYAGIPCKVKPPECSLFASLPSLFTVKKDSFSNWVSGLVELEPTIGSIVKSFEDGHISEVEAETQVGTLLGEAYSQFVKHGTTVADMEFEGTREGSGVVEAAWRVQGPKSKSRFSAVMRDATAENMMASGRWGARRV